MKTTSVWIAGAEGRLGAAIQKHLKNNTDYRIVATDMDVDITDMDSVVAAGDIYKPNVIINCATVNNEEDKIGSYKVNALGARNLAVVARRLNAKIIQFSTDDIFEGNKTGAVNEFDNPCPITIYGKSKLAGENYVRELNPKHVIVRSSWVYSDSENKQNDYLAYVLENGKNGTTFNARVDEVAAPTSAEVLADFIMKIIDEQEYGVFHVSCKGAVSRYDYAKYALACAGYSTDLVKTSTESQSSTVLENLMLELTDIYDMPEWKSTLKDFIESLDK